MEQMKALRCIIADDNELDRLTISSYLSHFPEFEILGIFENPVQALEAIQNEMPDIVFLDVDMPGMSGLELRKQISEVPVCIFATDHPEFALESFELETLDYLLKPYTFERFSMTVERIKEYMNVRQLAEQFESEKSEEAFFIKDGHRRIKISPHEIMALNALQNYTVIITKEEEKHYVLSTLGALLGEIHFQNFVRIHKSYAVNKNFIFSIDSKEIELKNGLKFPIGRSYKSSIELILNS